MMVSGEKLCTRCNSIVSSMSEVLIVQIIYWVSKCCQSLAPTSTVFLQVLFRVRKSQKMRLIIRRRNQQEKQKKRSIQYHKREDIQVSILYEIHFGFIILCSTLYFKLFTETSKVQCEKESKLKTQKTKLEKEMVTLGIILASRQTRRRPLLSTMAASLLLSRTSSFVIGTRAAKVAFQRTQSFPTLLPFSQHGVLVGSKFRPFSVLALSDSEIKPPIELHPSLGLLTAPFEVTAPYEPTGDQPEAIQQLIKQLAEGDEFSILRGITGTGKTFVMSHVIANVNKPTLVLCHNKTLAAQLVRELRSFLKNNAVELFVSYYNHYTPESFVEATGRYTAKKSSVNDEIDALRHRATRALLERRDVVVVASVSCIYGLGLPAEYLDASTPMTVGQKLTSLDLLTQFEKMLYSRPEDPNEMIRGNFQIASGPAGTVVSFWPPHEKFPMTMRLNNVENTLQIVSIHKQDHSGRVNSLDAIRIFPAKHHVVSDERREDACVAIEEELRNRVKELNQMGKVVESQRLQLRVLNDLQMLKETGTCSGAENYSRHFANREAGEPPDTLMDYFKLAGDGEFLLLVDESHVTLPQLKTMYGGDQSRKRSLVNNGYRLPSALDNRPLKEKEFWDQIGQAVFVSATPSKHELEKSPRPPVEMLIRPTFVCDPVIDVRPSKGQLADLVNEIKERAGRQERTLAMAITKRDAEDLSDFLVKEGISATFIHSGLTTHERSDALRSLQSGEIDCLVGVNLLREGLDLPQVSLVAILNADSEGFLRSETALLQTVGRAARNVRGMAILYADRITKSMRNTIDDTKRRREKQIAYNEDFGCESISTKGSTVMSIFDLLRGEIKGERPLEIMGRSDGAMSPKTVLQDMERIEIPLPSSADRIDIVTGHIPSKPGVYFWKDSLGNIMYIGKAKKLRNRVKSYLSPNAKHSTRISAMIAKATSVDFVLTPSDRDALILENNFIKHYQPPYNILLKDEEGYPYICASIGDSFPRFFASLRKQSGEKFSKYRYFGPYPHFNEINAVLGGIDEKYDLKAKSFEARHGDCTKDAYNELFILAMEEVFNTTTNNSLAAMRSQYEEANLLFNSVENKCRDIVAIGRTEDDARSLLVHVVQLREGLVAGRFSYSCKVPSGVSTNEDISAVIQTVLERQHYPSGEGCGAGRLTFFPNEILLQYPLEDDTELRKSIKIARTKAEPENVKRLVIRTMPSAGTRKDVDDRAMLFAEDNANQAALERYQGSIVGATKTSVDGTASAELASMLSLEKPPRRIECYDISHTQGKFAVGSRVVFINGKPSPTLYRTFNIKTFEGNDDYASLEEVLERRFRHIWADDSESLVGKGNPWMLPDLVVIDGGVGQLGSALKGMAKAGVFPQLQAKRLPVKFGDGNIVEEEVGIEIEVNHIVGGSQRNAHVAICALAKSREEVFEPGSSIPVNDSPDSPALLLLRSLRDESHRFALSKHRNRRSVVSRGI